MPAADFAGRWNIYEMALWPRDAIDLLGPAQIAFEARGSRLCRVQGRAVYPF